MLLRGVLVVVQLRGRNARRRDQVRIRRLVLAPAVGRGVEIRTTAPGLVAMARLLVTMLRLGTLFALLTRFSPVRFSPVLVIAVLLGSRWFNATAQLYHGLLTTSDHARCRNAPSASVSTAGLAP